jgi:hypothetical protein
MENIEKDRVDETQEISLRLEQYDDIFSDFDVRPYERRALSSDFLTEIKRASYDKSDNGIELALYVQEKKRDASKEPVIAFRLTAHFKKHFSILQKEKRSVVLMGASMVTLGIVCMILATLIIFGDPTSNIGLSFLVVFLEPAAWFLLWEGMDQIIFTSKNMRSELDFYRKMSNEQGRIIFKSGGFTSAS